MVSVCEFGRLFGSSLVTIQKYGYCISMRKIPSLLHHKTGVSEMLAKWRVATNCGMIKMNLF